MKTVRFEKYFSFISYYSTVSTIDSAYLIGGCTDFVSSPGCSEYSTAIVRYIDNEWARVGDLRTGRYKHRSLLVGNRAYIVGGHTQE